MPLQFLMQAKCDALDLFGVVIATPRHVHTLLARRQSQDEYEHSYLPFLKPPRVGLRSWSLIVCLSSSLYHVLYIISRPLNVP
jgi:hypothetical protein